MAVTILQLLFSGVIFFFKRKVRDALNESRPVFVLRKECVCDGDQNKKPVIVLGCFGKLDGGRDGGDVVTRVSLRWCLR
jgi:hypothetical protein